VKPLLIHLQNFMAYADETVSFEGLNLVSLEAAIGSGKSSLVEAVPFALYGYSRAQDGNDMGYEKLIKHGADTMAVTLDFRVGATTYRVKRERTRRGGSLSFFQRVGEAWDPLTAGKAKDTQALINAAAGMDLDTFAATSLLLQGQAGTFTEGMSDAERKQMLVDILDLDIYPRLKEAAAKKASAIEAKVEAARERLLLLEDSAAAAERHAEDLAARTQERAEAARALQGLRDDLAAAEEAARAAEAAQTRVRDLERQVSRLDEEHKIALEELEARALTARVGREGEVRQRQAVEMGAVVERGKAARAAVDAPTNRLADLSKRIPSLQHKIACVPEAPPANATEEYEAEIAVLLEREAEWKAQQAEMLAANEQWRDLRTARTRKGDALKVDLERTQQAAGRLSEDVRCIDLARAGCVFLADAKAAAERLPQLKESLAACVDPCPVEAEADRKGCSIAEAMGDIQEIKDAIATAHRRLSDTRVAAARAGERQVLEEQLATLQAEHAELEAALPGLQEALNALLAEAATLKRKHSEELQALSVYHDHEDNDARHRLRTAHEAKRVPLVWDLEEARGELVGQPTGEWWSPSFLRTKITEKEAALSALDRDLGNLEARLQRLQEDLAEVEPLRQHIAAQAAEQGEWVLLARLLDPKTGIPVELLRTVIPEVEARANDWLSTLYGGGMSLRLVTEAAQKNGNEKDVLRLEIVHGGFTQDYSLCSGGEKFCVNVALRLSISQLMASRRGVRLETLILDEGFGNLDAQTIDAVLAILERAREQFSLVLVVSHQHDLCSRLPARLKVEKTPAGSRITRVA